MYSAPRASRRSVYGVEGVEICRSSCGCARPAAESGASALGEERELIMRDVEARKVCASGGDGVGDFGFGLWIDKGEEGVVFGARGCGKSVMLLKALVHVERVHIMI